MFRLVIFSCLFLVTFAASHRRAKPSQGRIVGGHDTDIGDVPHQVSVQYNGNHHCGGTIVGLRHILTAAHCLLGANEKLFSIRAGSNYHKKGGQEVKVVKVIKNPKFDENTYNNDAAILVLKESLKLNERVQIAPLANVEPKVGEMVLISGWGSTEEGKRTASNNLLSVSVPVVSKEDCKTHHPDDEITDQMFCAGYLEGGKDSCNGDSGGPAIVKKQLAGIISWGVGCARKNSPGVYTSIASIKDWISTEIKK